MAFLQSPEWIVGSVIAFGLVVYVLTSPKHKTRRPGKELRVRVFLDET